MKNKETFQVKIEDKDVTLSVFKPTQRVLDEAQKVYNKRYCELVNAGTLVKPEVDSILRNRGVWGEKEEKEFTELRKKLLDSDLRLAKGKMKLVEAKSLAFEMMKNRRRLLELSFARSSLDGQTAENQAEQHRFNYLVACCTVYDNNDKQVFESLNDYLDRSEEEYAIVAATNLAKLMSSIEDYQSKLPENKFLIKYGFMNDKYKLVDKDGKLVNEDGKHVDENGRFIHWEGDKFKFVDVDGNEVDSEGNYVVQFEPFLDDDGEAVEPKK